MPALNAEQLAPHNVEAEEALLGAVLIDPDTYYQVSHFIHADQFFIVKHGWVWDAMTALLARGDSLDYISLIDELRARGQLDELGGPAYLTRLMNHTPSSIYAETYARLIERACVRRGLMSAASQIARLANDGDKDLTAVLDLSAAALATASAGRATDSTAKLDRVADELLAVLDTDRKSTRLNSSHIQKSRMPSSA